MKFHYLGAEDKLDMKQIVWWMDSPRLWQFGFLGAYPNEQHPIYSWSLLLGPIEVRRWAI